jgi:hypothetical protein
MLEVSRDAAALGEEQLVSCAAEQSKYCSICKVTFDPCGDLPFMSWGRWQCLRGGADVGLNSCYSVCGCGTKYRCGETCGDMLEAMARIAPSQPNEASRARSLGRISEIVLEGHNTFKQRIGLGCSRKAVAHHHAPKCITLRSAQQRSAGPPPLVLYVF